MIISVSSSSMANSAGVKNLGASVTANAAGSGQHRARADPDQIASIDLVRHQTFPFFSSSAR